jgi:hypothetical protein
MMSFMMFHLEGFWEVRNIYIVLVGNLKGRDCLGNIDVNRVCQRAVFRVG